MMTQNVKKQVKAVGLMSGGLDSALAAKIVKDLGVEVHGIHFVMPWELPDHSCAMKVSAHLGIEYMALQFDRQYLDIVKNPQYGYGSAMNPCVDCHIHMLVRAGQYMKQIGADFVFTGEILGQRPMSQRGETLRQIEKRSGLEGRLLRPLSAKLLEPTIPELQGWIDRERLLDISGRSRRLQYDLAETLNVTGFHPPGGGCLLTDKNFSRRMKDALDHGYRDRQEIIILQWGRHFRLNEHFKAIVGRDDTENESLIRHAHPDDHIMLLAEKMGPLLLLQGLRPTDDILATCGGLIQQFSRYKNGPAERMQYWQASDQEHIQYTMAKKLDKAHIAQIQL